MIIPDVILLNTDHDAKRAIPTIAKKEEANIRTPLMSIPQMKATIIKSTEKRRKIKNFFM